LPWRQPPRRLLLKMGSWEKLCGECCAFQNYLWLVCLSCRRKASGLLYLSEFFFGFYLISYLFFTSVWHSPRVSTPVRSSSNTELCMKYTVVLIRHGESTWNDENRFTGWYDCPLSEKGEQEAIAGGKLLKEAGFTFDKAYTSTLKRAIKTLWNCLEQLDLMYIPIVNKWRYVFFTLIFAFVFFLIFDLKKPEEVMFSAFFLPLLPATPTL